MEEKTLEDVYIFKTKYAFNQNEVYIKIICLWENFYNYADTERVRYKATLEDSIGNKLSLPTPFNGEFYVYSDLNEPLNKTYLMVEELLDKSLKFVDDELKYKGEEK